MFELVSKYSPSGDQPEAIKSLVNGINSGKKEQVLLGATGTGKTFTYIKTMYELNKNYGWSKFIVITPSIAIREGVEKSFKLTEEFFQSIYNKKIRYFKNVKLFKHPNNDLLNEELKVLKDNYFDIYKLQENKDLIIKIDKQIFL